MDGGMLFAEERWPSLVALLNERAASQADCRALGYASDWGKQTFWKTYRELDREARALAARLQRLNTRGKPALLLHPPGLEFAAAFLGCLYAGVIAVPSHLPRPRRSLDRLEGIVNDCGAEIVLTTESLLPELSERFRGHGRLRGLCWLATDNIDVALGDAWQPPVLERGTTACLQYTSGSTAAPRGVVLSHGNLLANSRLIYEAFQHSVESFGVIWLPPYHDMGLIGGIVQPLFAGFPCVLMSPVEVVQQPLRWLEAVSRFHATTSGGPNFIYDACVARIRPEECQELDLSSWRVAFNGAEPIRAETLERFAAKFAPFGFRPEAFFPCYGLAEATLCVSGGPPGRPPLVRPVSRNGLEHNTVASAAGGDLPPARMVGCGALRQEVRIVDPETHALAGEESIGEIWVGGPSVSQGYWANTAETSATFGVSRAGADDAKYLRTGDLGFVSEGQLFVTGRLKDLLIVNGRNHYPQDIELSVERCHPALRTHGGAAFALDAHGQQLAVVHEVERHGRGADLGEVIAAVRQAISEQHELAVHTIALVRMGGVPKTPSGKIQRQRCRELLLRGNLPLLSRWEEGADWSAAHSAESPHVNDAATGEVARPALVGPSRGFTAEIQTWLVTQIARRVRCPVEAIDVRQPLARYGLKSLDAMELTGELERWLRRPLSPALIYSYPTIERLAHHLAAETAPEPQRLPPPVAAPPIEPIAIVGIGCRFPGAGSPAGFWKVLIDGVDAITEVPSERWNASEVDALLNRGNGGAQSTVRWGGWLDGIDRFDAAFFGTAPREAACIDPQHRLLLEVAWEALEDSGQPADRLRGTKTGVFVGISTNDYRNHFVFRTSQLDPYWSTGNAGCMAANRLSYFFDFRGPSLAIDTACSSSLVAVHEACNSLRRGDCALALAGGVNVILSPDISFSFAKGGALAADGRCKAFSAAADGIVRSEGVGVVVLKRLSQALADGDRIYALVRGSAVSQDGRSNGITAPNQAAQEAVIRDAWQNAGAAPTEARYFETHGAGTLLGDVIEANALRAILADRPADEQPCTIGSVKSNIGHCEAAAGVASLIKVALSLHHGQLPASLHCQNPNPHIRFDSMPFSVQTTATAWSNQGGRGLAGVSAFGFGGTNAHLVVESLALPRPAPAVEPLPVNLLPLSAATRPALVELATRWRSAIVVKPSLEPTELTGLCQVVATRRSHLDERAALRFRTRAQLVEQLDALCEGKGHPRLSSGRIAHSGRPRLTFVFSGHGGQWAGMHRPLMAAFPAFRDTLTECDRLLRAHADWSLLAELNNEASPAWSDQGPLEVVQTCLFAFQIALVEAWKAWGIEPDAVVGHSMGEVAAAYTSGALSLPDAIRLIVERSRLLQHALENIGAAGGMAALRVSGEEAEQLLRPYEGRVWVAVENSPNYTVVSGERAALEELVAQLRQAKTGARVMHVPGAAHTPMLEPTRRTLEAALAGLTPHPARVPFYSTVHGRRCDALELDAAYWGQNIRQPVRFAPTIRQLSADGYQIFVEIGPHPLLTAAVNQTVERHSGEAAALPSWHRGDQDLDSLLGALGALYVKGAEVDWRPVYPGSGRWLDLPLYPWQRQRCWTDLNVPSAAAWTASGGSTPAIADAAPDMPTDPSRDGLLQAACDSVVADTRTNHAAAPISPSSATVPPELLEDLRRASREDRRTPLLHYLRGHLAATLRIAASEIAFEEPLTHLGVDSLMAMEIKNRVEAELQVRVQMVELLEGPTLSTLADLILPQLADRDLTTERAPAVASEEEDVVGTRAMDLLEGIDGLSDEEVDALMHRMLAS